MVQVVTPGNLGPEFEIGTTLPNKITVAAATQLTAGKVKLATPSEISSNSTTTAVSPQDVATMIANAISGLGGAGTATAGATPPASPAVGDRWFNTSAGTVAGVPSASWSTWNGSSWSVDTNGAASSGPVVTSSATAPVAPALGDRWYNSSAATVSGVPATSWATWDGAAWKVDTNGAAAGGSVVTSSATAPVSPALGDRWYNSSAATVSGVPAASWATWDGAAWKVDTNGAAAGGSYVATVSTTAPVSPAVGDRWYNSDTVTVSGVPKEAWSTWTGTKWAVDTNQPAADSTPVEPTDLQPGDLWRNTGASVVNGVLPNAVAIWDGAAWIPISEPQLKLTASGNKSIPNNGLITAVDTVVTSVNEFGAASFAAGVFTVPAGYGGVFAIQYNMYGTPPLGANNMGTVGLIGNNSAGSIVSREFAYNDVAGNLQMALSSTAVVTLAAGDTVSIAATMNSAFTAAEIYTFLYSVRRLGSA